MALISCPECNHEMSNQAKTCPNCGYKLPKVKKELSDEEKKKKRQKLIIRVVIVILFFTGTFSLYFFLSPKTVTWCCYHRIDVATCTESEHCSRCGQTWGEPKGHTWMDATCTVAKTCEICGATEGSGKGHDWKIATCTEPKTCKNCKKTEGKESGHSWKAATCTTPKKCSSCGKTEGSMLGHNISEYICTRCEESIVKRSDVPNILDITSMTYEINYVGGIDQYMAFTNKSSTKTINYITVKLQFYNDVGDIIKDDISHRDYVSLRYTGPIKPGKSTSRGYWRACFYNSTFGGNINIQEIEIEYSDGTTLILDEDIADEAVKAWR